MKVRVIIPSQLGTLTDAPREVDLDVDKPVSLTSVLDTLETAYPSLRGLLRDPSTGMRRPMIRFFVAEEDVSHIDMDESIGSQLAGGKNEIWIVAAISGGAEKETQSKASTAYWELIHAERSRLADMLDNLQEDDWHSQSLCSNWSVEETVAHLTAGANTGMLAWLFSMVRAGFNAEKHNQRRLISYLGDTPADTLEQFRKAINQTIAPTKDYAAWLGEVIVHGQDIAAPLDMSLTPDPKAVMEVASFFAKKDFAVNSKTLVYGLALEADDEAFQVGSGLKVRGHLLDLVMAMAGRQSYIDRLEGSGVDELRRRLG